MGLVWFKLKDWYLVIKKDGDVDHDLKWDAGKAGGSIDVDGNLWIVNEGKIYSCSLSETTFMYTRGS